jgi:tetratricopeptide (TPR) repeat protein
MFFHAPESPSSVARVNLAFWQRALTPLIAIAVFFGILEGVLALAGVEPVLRSEDPFVGFVPGIPLFVEQTDAEGRKILATPDNKLVFFNRQRFPQDKAPGTYRIFCLGGSTTYGRPYSDATSFAGWLRELLPVADAQRRWEVINAGGISYASYRVAHLMEELVRYEPDLFVIYTGHNEFLEERTYGALRDLPAAVRSTAALLARTRTWAAMKMALNFLGSAPSVKKTSPSLLPAEVNTMLDRSAGPERYARDDILRDQILLHYRISLERIADIAMRAGAEVIFVTPASNLKDSTPFKSQHTDGLSASDRSRSEALLADAQQRIGASAWHEALELLDAALAIDPRFAELHYRRGAVLLALGRADEAAAAFRRARDEDVCPLRALSPMRETVAEVAREKGATLVDFVDLVERRALAEQGFAIPGAEYFLDHVHPTIAGNRILALALVDALIAKGVVRPAASWGDEAVAGVVARVEGRIDRKAHAQALANLARVLSWAGKDEEARRLANRALAAAPELATANADVLAILSEREGDTVRTWQYLRTALNEDPANPQIHFQIGLEMLNKKPPGWSLEAAAAHVLWASAFMPENDMTHQILGLIMAERERFAVAYPSLLEALRLNPRNAEAESALVRLREILGPELREDPPKVSLKRYPSGAPEQIVQVRPDAAGGFIPDGIATEWYEAGEPRRLLDYANGVPHGVELIWDPSGRVLSRAEYRNGIRMSASD